MKTFEELLKDRIQDRIQALTSGRSDATCPLSRIDENERMLKLLNSKGINVIIGRKP